MTRRGKLFLQLLYDKIFVFLLFVAAVINKATFFFLSRKKRESEKDDGSRKNFPQKLEF